MATRTLSDVAPTATTIALNAYIYGYAGHSLVTPHMALKQLWWTEERISLKVTHDFIVSRLRGNDRTRLREPLAFGESLTDDTYVEWILNRARRLFLVLSHIGIADQIFRFVDDALDDDDLPMSLETARNLHLSGERSDIVTKQFYDAQFIYLLRELKQGQHLDYEPNEHIPMDYANTLPPAVTLQGWHRVHFPGRPDQIFVRRKFDLKDGQFGQNLRQSFRKDIRTAQCLQHQHIAPAWASYTVKDSAYILSDFVGEHTLGSFMAHRLPPQFAQVAQDHRPALLCEWMHCLADAVAYLHERNVAHANITPSNIIINRQNHIAFADVGTIRTLQRGKRVVTSEAYDYAAPDSQIVRVSIVDLTGASESSPLSYNKFYQRTSSSCGSPDDIPPSSPCLSGTWGLPYVTRVATAMSSPRDSQNTVEIDTIYGAGRSSSAEGVQGLNFVATREATCPNLASSPHLSPNSMRSTVDSFRKSSDESMTSVDLFELPRASAQQSDVFSLGCVLLDIVTFIVQGRVSDFAKFRRSRIKALRFPGTPRSRKVQVDASFHDNLDKVSHWISIVERNAWSRGSEHTVLLLVPALLDLIRSMLSQNPSLRPSARRVRDTLRDVLSRDIHISNGLCCANRQWTFGEIPDDDEDTNDRAKTKSSKRSSVAASSVQVVRPATSGVTSVVHSSLSSLYLPPRWSIASTHNDRDCEERPLYERPQSVASITTANTILTGQTKRPRFSWFRRS